MKDKGLEKILKAGWKISSKTKTYLILSKENVEMLYMIKGQRIMEVYLK